MVEVQEMKYSENGLWILKTGNNYRIGLSEKGQDDLGEVMFIEVLSHVTRVEQNETLIDLEGAKAVTELTSPLAGKVVSYHKALADEPEKLNSVDKEFNWIVELTDVDETVFNTLSDTID
ncbi:glycine cleavage system H protein [Carnobacterium iners]|uniref:Glycine cleavage system H protein n=1 Tax=Carnobacterium iners TaxID=1073423 RepID=A0A1X7MPB7_9LACT|nr:glycine cleavage system protein H [Carnobacterium iners]SEK94368.1 glycine cleavage system H protein [Carnobacterium iners]SMH26670.1 glycine cleavage system H protein [Carnobacterium iners]